MTDKFGFTFADSKNIQEIIAKSIAVLFIFSIANGIAILFSQSITIATFC